MRSMPICSLWCPPRSASRRLLSAVTVAVVASTAFGFAMVTSVVTAASASAHAELVKITPDVDAQVTTAPKDVVLEFSEPVNTSFTTVVVTSAAGASVTSGKPTVVGTKVTQALVPRMAAGVYRVAFRVVSNDGHPVAGESRFTLTLAPTTSPSPSGLSASPPSASPSVTPSGATTDVAPLPSPNAGQSGGLSRSSLATAAAFALLLIGAGLFAWRRKHP
jgi:methionine-rich copper-binding protein CopC